MGAWTAERADRANDGWAFIPPEGRRFETSNYLLVVVPGTFSFNYVYWFRAPPAQTEGCIEQVLKQVRSEGGTGVRWLIRSDSSPADLGRRLTRHGFRQVESAETLYRAVRPTARGAGAPSPPHGGGIVAREAVTEPEYDDFVRIMQEVFGDEPSPPAVAHQFRELYRRRVAETGHSDRFLAYQGKEPVGCGGLEVTGNVGRLWGGAVRSEYRGRGAYVALVEERCRSAAERGADVAITVARVGSSGPILKRHGFQVAGTQSTFELRWDQPPGSAP
jgi:GNAT superfamily N-acetyltransferase